MTTGGKPGDLTRPSAVTAAIAEFDKLGRDAFLEKYGFWRSNRFFVYQDGVGYDSKPIVASAYGHQFGRQQALHYDDFGGGAPVIRTLEPLGFQVVHWTSPKLVQNTAYTRKTLIQMFGIKDSTVNNGVFRPKDTNSIWLFVTKDKTSDRTPYQDHFESDLLFWQGQMAGRTDQTIIDHETNGDELLVFYRDSKRTLPGAGFRYEGQFRYLRHNEASPTNFVLQRSSSRQDVEMPATPFDPMSIEDGRAKIWAQVKRRQGQPKFRAELIRAYVGQCAVTGCSGGGVARSCTYPPLQGC